MHTFSAAAEKLSQLPACRITQPPNCETPAEDKLQFLHAKPQTALSETLHRRPLFPRILRSGPREDGEWLALGLAFHQGLFVDPRARNSHSGRRRGRFAASQPFSRGRRPPSQVWVGARSEPQPIVNSCFHVFSLHSFSRSRHTHLSTYSPQSFL